MYIEGFHRNPSLFIAAHSLIQNISFFKDRFHRKQCVQHAWKSRIGDAVGTDLYDLLRRNTDIKRCIGMYFQLSLATAQRQQGCERNQFPFLEIKVWTRVDVAEQLDQ